MRPTGHTVTAALLVAILGLAAAARAQAAPDPCVAVTTTTDQVPPGIALAVTWTQTVNVTTSSTDAPVGFYLQVDATPEVQYIPSSFVTCPDAKRGYLWTSLPPSLNPGNHTLKITPFNYKDAPTNSVVQRGTATVRNFTVLNPTVNVPAAPGNLKIQPSVPVPPPPAAPPPP